MNVFMKVVRILKMQFKLSVLYRPIQDRVRCLLVFLIAFLGYTGVIFGQVNPNHVYVKGYTRSDGTYVEPHYRTVPNSTNIDNFSTIGNTNPYTGEPGWVPRDNNKRNNYTISSIGRNSSKEKYKKTEFLKNTGNPSYWVSKKVNKFLKKTIKKDNRNKRKLLSDSKRLIRRVKNRKELNIKNFADGWYNTIMYSSIKIDSKYKKVAYERKAFLKNGKVVKYIGANNLVYDISQFVKTDKDYLIKLIFPDNSISKDFAHINFYENSPLKRTPQFEYPSILFFYVTGTNNGGKISITLENKELVFWGGYLYKYWNELPNCQTPENIIKFYLPKGRYKFYADNSKSLWTNESLIVNEECQGIRLTF